MKLFVLALTLVLSLPCLPAAAQNGPPIEKQELSTLLKFLRPPELVQRIEANGVAFDVDENTLEELKRLGASSRIIDAIRGASGAHNRTPGKNGTISYEDLKTLLKVGISERQLSDKIRNSNTRFVLGADQLRELRMLGVSETIITLLKGVAGPSRTPREVTDLAIVLDCSGSMKQRTSDGRQKLDAAKQVVKRLIEKMPEGMGLTVIVYGHDARRQCQAVEVLHPLHDVDLQSKQRVMSSIERLRPAGSTPIALALSATRGELLRKNAANAGVILVSDGKETCNGNPVTEARQLVESVKVDFGVHIVGFDVSEDERAALEEIRRAVGKNGFYHDARDAGALVSKFDELTTKLDAVAQPENRNASGFQVTQNAQPGAFFHDAPLVSDGRHGGKLGFMESHYYSIPVRSGQQLIATGLIQKADYKAFDQFLTETVNQTFHVVIYDQDFVRVAEREVAVSGNPKAAVSVSAKWTPEKDTIAYIGIAASHNHSTEGAPITGRLNKNVKPARYMLNLRLNGELATDLETTPVPQVSVKPTFGIDDAKSFNGPGKAGGDLKVGEAVYYAVRAKGGELLRVSAAVQKPWYDATTQFLVFNGKAKYQLSVYDDAFQRIAEKAIVVTGNRPDGHTLAVDAPIELDGVAYICVSSENLGGAPKAEPNPGWVTVQATPVVSARPTPSNAQSN